MNHSRYLPHAKKYLQLILLLAIMFFNFGSGGTIAVLAAPGNDNFPGTTIGVNPYTNTVDTTTATEEANDPLVAVQCDGRLLAKGKKSVWYTYAPTKNQPVSIDTFGSNYDTYLSLWTGTYPNLTFLACDDDNPNNLQSQITINLQAGVTYYIEVAGYAGTVTPPDPQPNLGGNLVFHLKTDKDTVGVFRPSNGALYLRNSNTTGFADVAINYGLAGDYPVVGDWDGDGDDTIGVYRNGTFLLRNSNSVGFANITVAFGAQGDQPIAGDWNNDGVDTIGIFRSSTATFMLRNSNTPGAPDITFALGIPGDVGIAGDWNGDGVDTTGVFRPSNGVIFLKNTNTSGIAEIALNYGLPGDQPVVGDWDNNGTTTIGVYRSARFYLRNSNTNGFANILVDLGNVGDMPIAGNWDGVP